MRKPILSCLLPVLPCVLMVVAGMAGGIPAHAQSIVGVKVSASLPSAAFWVDGQMYKGAAHFAWPAGSKHTLEIRNPQQVNENLTSRTTFTSWSAGAGTMLRPGDLVQSIVADPLVTSYTASFVQQFRVEMLINYEPIIPWKACNEPWPSGNIPMPDPYPSRYGFIDTAGACGCVSFSTYSWMDSGAQLSLAAIAYPGFAFKGWLISTAQTLPFFGALTITGPTTIRALFDDARRVFVETSPVRGLQVVVNRSLVTTKSQDGECLPAPIQTPYPGPTEPVPPYDSVPPIFPPGYPKSTACRYTPLCQGEFDFLPGSDNLFGAPASQKDRMGNLWVFDVWDVGGGQTAGQNYVFKMPADYRPYTLTARFVKGIRTSFVTTPVQLKLKIDGRDNWPSYNFEWGLGHKHTISAPAEQVDAKGRRYRFVGWSNDGPADQTVTVVEDTAAPGSFRMTARYELLGQLKLQSDPSSLSFNVSGAECKTPCVVDRPAGAMVTIYPVPEASYSADTKAVFQGWTDGGGADSRDFTFTTGSQTLAAKYTYLQRFTAITDPDGAANWTFEPPAQPGGYFPAGTQVLVTADARPGYKFRRWEGALSGPYNAGWVTMTGPATVVARLDKVPTLAADAVRNAAGPTPVDGVAPGSIISIRGYSLVAQSERGPESPLTQTLQGLTVQMNGRILPLISVTPEEIQAQLPSGLEPGSYTLAVKPATQAALSTRFRVYQNAPGLFRLPETPEETPLALALHADGSPVTAESPAQAGETLSILGTGFGRVEPAPLDGFAVPSEPPAALKDTLELLIGGELRQASWSGALAGRVGLSVLRLKVDPTMGQGQNVELKVRINGQDSNTVLLPLQ
ncbi:MAG: hypothetical protein HY858_06570 [Candidatus Solibacter usitatus]|nr:hypothetical protein [Candidatus Solibacter usitatus]